MSKRGQCMDVSKCIAEDAKYSYYLEASDGDLPMDILQQSTTFKKLQYRVASKPRVLCCNDSVIVAAIDLLTKRGSVRTAAIKVVSPERAWFGARQLYAEQEAAELLPCDIRAGTVLAIARDASGSVSSISQFAGVSLHDVMQHHAWPTAPLGVKAKLAKQLLASALWVHSKLQAAPGGSRVYRDTKPANLCLGRSGIISVIDYGTLCRASGDDFHVGYTPRYLTPELADPTDGQPLTLKSDSHFQAATSVTTDVFLLGKVSMELISGMPPEVDIDCHDIDTKEGELDFQAAVVEHDWSSCEAMQKLINNGHAELANLLTSMLHRDPQQRPTPQEALQHPCLAEAMADVEAAVAAEKADYESGRQEILDLLEARLSNCEDVFIVGKDPCPEVLLPQRSSSTAEPGTPCISGTSQLRPDSSSSSSSCCCSNGSIECDVIGSNSNSSGDDDCANSSSSSCFQYSKDKVELLACLQAELQPSPLEEDARRPSSTEQLSGELQLPVAEAVPCYVHSNTESLHLLEGFARVLMVDKTLEPCCEVPQRSNSEAGPGTPSNCSTRCSKSTADNADSSSSDCGGNDSSSSTLINPPEADSLMCPKPQAQQHALLMLPDAVQHNSDGCYHAPCSYSTQWRTSCESCVNDSSSCSLPTSSADERGCSSGNSSNSEAISQREDEACTVFEAQQLGLQCLQMLPQHSSSGDSPLEGPGVLCNCSCSTSSGSPNTNIHANDTSLWCGSCSTITTSTITSSSSQDAGSDHLLCRSSSSGITALPEVVPMASIEPAVNPDGDEKVQLADMLMGAAAASCKQFELQLQHNISDNGTATPCLCSSEDCSKTGPEVSSTSGSGSSSGGSSSGGKISRTVCDRLPSISTAAGPQLPASSAPKPGLARRVVTRLNKFRICCTKSLKAAARSIFCHTNCCEIQHHTNHVDGGQPSLESTSSSNSNNNNNNNNNSDNSSGTISCSNISSSGVCSSSSSNTSSSSSSSSNSSNDTFSCLQGASPDLQQSAHEEMAGRLSSSTGQLSNEPPRQPATPKCSLLRCALRRVMKTLRSRSLRRARATRQPQIQLAAWDV